MRHSIAFALALGISVPAGAASPPTPLFSSDAPIRIAIQGPIGSIARSAEQSTAPKPATLSVVGSPETYAIQLSARGIARRRKETCDFPPLRVDLVQPPAATSLFAGQRRLKLVTHCRGSAAFQQYLLLEYASYRIFNLLSPASFRVRLANVDYLEPGGRVMVSRMGFFIEDRDDVGRRNGLRPAMVGDRVTVQQLDAAASARVALFQYMIGNLDWSMRAGPAGEGCCHNSRLFNGAGPGLISVPYDFDYSGLVDAPYAIPPAQFHIRNVKTRVYQGYCAHNGAAIATAAQIRAQRPAIEGLFGQIPMIEDRTRQKALAFLSRYFDETANDDSVRTRVLRGCT